MIKKIKFPELKNENFTIVPIPFEDELLSSWIVRTAYAHKTHPHTFVNQYLNYRPYSFFLTESDITLDKTMIKIIEEKSHHKIDIHSLMLTTYSGFLQENVYDNNPSIFFTHLKYCPVCLREDKIPYFRKTWRVVFYNICHKHKCRLYEHCPSCKTNLDISKMYENELPYTHCHHCGFELKKGRKLPIHKKYISSLDYQNKIFKVIHDGYIQLDETPIYSFLFFEVFSKLSKLILVNKKHKFIDQHSLLSHIKDVTQQKINHPIFKKIDAKAQSALFGLIMYMFDNFPRNFESYIIQNKLTYHDMTTKIPYIPFWYETIVNEITPIYLPHSMTVTQEEVQHAERYLKAIGKEINKVNLSKLLGCNFYSNDNNLKSYIVK
jgi:hypothetical protein